jgi:hypothetical protein
MRHSQSESDRDGRVNRVAAPLHNVYADIRGDLIRRSDNAVTRAHGFARSGENGSRLDLGANGGELKE